MEPNCCQEQNSVNLQLVTPSNIIPKSNIVLFSSALAYSIIAAVVNPNLTLQSCIPRNWRSGKDNVSFVHEGRLIVNMGRPKQIPDPAVDGLPIFLRDGLPLDEV